MNIDVQLDVLDERKVAPTIDANLVGVTVHDSLVAMTNNALLYAEKLSAAHFVGVKATADIKEQIKRAFARSASLSAAKIEVESNNGQVTLKGKVHSLAEFSDAELAALAAPGVTGVRNELRVG